MRICAKRRRRWRCLPTCRASSFCSAPHHAASSMGRMSRVCIRKYWQLTIIHRTVPLLIQDMAPTVHTCTRMYSNGHGHHIMAMFTSSTTRLSCPPHPIPHIYGHSTPRTHSLATASLKCCTAAFYHRDWAALARDTPCGESPAKSQTHSPNGFSSRPRHNHHQQHRSHRLRPRN